MQKQTKIVTVVTSGTYDGPQGRSTGALISEVLPPLPAGQDSTVFPRFVISHAGSDADDSFLFLLNKRLSGSYELVEDVTSELEMGSSSAEAREGRIREKA